MRTLLLVHNFFSGFIPNNDFFLPDLEMVDLSFNQLEGIRAAVSYVSVLMFDESEVRCNAPGRLDCFALSENLRELRASNNRIASFIPAFHSKKDLVLVRKR